jgi:hemoglobin
MGGPASYTDEHLRRVHARLGISTADFREMIALLEDVLQDYDVADSDVEVVLAAIRRREGVIVSRV